MQRYPYDESSLEGWPMSFPSPDSELETTSYWSPSYNGFQEYGFDYPSNQDTTKSYFSDAGPAMGWSRPVPMNDSPLMESSAFAQPLVSRMFGPTYGDNARPATDLTLLTSDNVMFYIDEATLSKVSKNNFNGILPLQPPESLRRMVYLAELQSRELQVILQIIYNISYDSENSYPDWQNPTNYADVQAIIHGISLLPLYGLDPKTRIHPQTKMFAYMLTCAPIYPLDVYTLAARHNLYELAVSASSHLLTIDLNSISPLTAEQIGPLYLGKLYELIEERKSKLSNLLAMEPSLHNPTKRCGFNNQQVLKNHWNRAVSSLICNMNAGVSTAAIRDVIRDATRGVTCQECVKARDTRLHKICTEWSMVARTIR